MSCLRKFYLGSIFIKNTPQKNIFGRQNSFNVIHLPGFNLMLADTAKVFPLFINLRRIELEEIRQSRQQACSYLRVQVSRQAI